LAPQTSLTCPTAGTVVISRAASVPVIAPRPSMLTFAPIRTVGSVRAALPALRRSAPASSDFGSTYCWTVHDALFAALKIAVPSSASKAAPLSLARRTFVTTETATLYVTTFGGRCAASTCLRWPDRSRVTRLLATFTAPPRATIGMSTTTRVGSTLSV
jgi:hypothetical protein